MNAYVPVLYIPVCCSQLSSNELIYLFYVQNILCVSRSKKAITYTYVLLFMNNKLLPPY